MACAWAAVPSGTHLLVPDGCVDMLWLSSGDLWVCGPETAAWSFALPAATTAVGVRLRPGVASILFAVDVSTLRDRRKRLGCLVGARVEARLAADIAAADAPVARRDVLEGFVAELAQAADHACGLAFVDAVLDALAVSPRASVAQLASMIGVGERQLHRRSRRAFGYGTATLARLLRLQRFLALADATRSIPSLTWLASEAGYSDHAHLCSDCRAITGQTPSEYLGNYFPTFPDMTDPFRTKVPLVGRR